MTTITKDRGPDDLFVAEDEREIGLMSPFFAAYRTAERKDRYGWYCSNCDGVQTVMDTLGRIECTDCGNRHKPRQWDAAYL
jgi:hypothetical protein